MVIYTTYFDNLKNISGDGSYFVSIAGQTPEWFERADDGRHFKMTKLAPRAKWWHEWQRLFRKNPNSDKSVCWYSEKYLNTVLRYVTPSQVVNALKAISDEPTARFFMVCYEPPNRFCHRMVFREWFNSFETPGVDAVVEFGQGNS